MSPTSGGGAELPVTGIAGSTTGFGGTVCGCHNVFWGLLPLLVCACRVAPTQICRLVLAAPAGWLLAADAAAEQADALIRGQLRLHSRRQLQSLPALTHRTGELLVQARQLLGRAKPWLPVFMWRELLSRLRSREDGQRYLATKTGKRREWQGASWVLVPACVACGAAHWAHVLPCAGFVYTVGARLGLQCCQLRRRAATAVAQAVRSMQRGGAAFAEVRAGVRCGPPLWRV